MKKLFPILTLMTFVLSFCNNTQAQTGIGTTTPHASAMLDINSTSKGLLPPRMTAVQRGNISSPAAGLLVYDLDSNAYMFFSSGNWKRVGSGEAESIWSRKGTHILTSNSGNVLIGSMDTTLAAKLQVVSRVSGMPAIYGSSEDTTGFALGINGLVKDTGAAVYGAAYQSGGYAAPELRSFGVVGTAGAGGTGVGAYAQDGIALRAKASGNNGIAISSQGAVQLKGINEGAGKVLTSDGSGNASWQPPVSGNWNTAGNDISNANSGNVGIGTGAPSEKLEVAGAVKLGNTASANPGTIRYNNNDFEGYNGSQWKSLTATGTGGSGGSGPWTVNGNNIYNNNSGMVNNGNQQTGKLLVQDSLASNGFGKPVIEARSYNYYAYALQGSDMNISSPGGGVLGASTNGTGVKGQSINSNGIEGTAFGPYGVGGYFSSSSSGYPLVVQGRMRLAQDNNPVAADGTIRFNGTTFEGFDGTNWLSFGGGGWAASGSDIHNGNSGNVGIGTAAPKAAFTVGGNKKVVFGDDTSGSGTRLMWIPSKAAFRAGTANGGNWDYGNIGNNSVATGFSAAHGGASAAFGGSVSSGDFATASGFSSASGNSSTALGYSIASGISSAALGNSTASGNYSLSTGTSTAAGGHAAALGESAASGDYALAAGFSTAPGNTATATGYSAAYGTAATALGFSVARGDYSVSLGNFNISKAFSGVATGAFNDTADFPNPAVPAASDRLFQIGNGTGPVRSNAVTVLRNGNVGIGVLDPVQKLDVAGSVKIVDGTEGAGKVLTSDDYGNASWQNPTGGGSSTTGWIVGGNDLFNANSGNIGIGTSNPQEKLQVENANVLFTSPVSGYGGSSRFKWYAGKAAVKLGGESFYCPDCWDADSVGQWSFASGFDTKASGQLAIAFGFLTTASNSGSSAFGSFTRADGWNATAFGEQTMATGKNTLTTGYMTSANELNATAFGNGTTANGSGAFATGWSSVAEGDYSAAFGQSDSAIGANAFASGYNTKARGNNSFSAGNGTEAGGSNATAIGTGSLASGENAMAAGFFSVAGGYNSKAFGQADSAKGGAAVTMGYGTKAEGDNSFAAGAYAVASGTNSMAAGFSSVASGFNAKAFGHTDTASGYSATTMGYGTKAQGNYAMAQGYTSVASGEMSFANGYGAVAMGYVSSAFGQGDSAKGYAALATGFYTKAEGNYALSAGYSSLASGASAVATGNATLAAGDNSFAAGSSSQATGANSAGFGQNTYTSGTAAIAMGDATRATGTAAFTAGSNLTAQGYASAVFGMYNDSVAGSSQYGSVPTDPLLLVGNGDYSARHNAFAILKNGKAGFNTSTPEAEIDVVYDGAASDPQLRLFENANDYARLNFQNNSGSQYWSIAGYNHITNATERLKFSNSTSGDIMSITGDGKVGIGTSDPIEKLQVCGNLRVNGNIRATSTITANQSFTCSSDQRFKKNVQTLDSSLLKLLQLRGVSYYWKQEDFPDRQFNDRLQIGVIAQELEKIFPELVYTDMDGFKSVDYAKLTPILIEALKELKEGNDALKRSNADLEKQTASLENRLSRLEQLVSGQTTGDSQPSLTGK